MKPIESDAMEPENPRVYRLVLTGGELKICVKKALTFSLDEKTKENHAVILSHFIFRHHPVLALSSMKILC